MLDAISQEVVEIIEDSCLNMKDKSMERENLRGRRSLGNGMDVIKGIVSSFLPPISTFLYNNIFFFIHMNVFAIL